MTLSKKDPESQVEPVVAHAEIAACAVGELSNLGAPDDLNATGRKENSPLDCAYPSGNANAPVAIVHHAEAMLHETRAAIARGWALTPANGKAPFRPGWQREVPLSLGDLEALTRRCNMALRCGRPSGVLVLDDDSVEQYIADLPSLPATVTAITGRGRRHYYFRMPDVAVPNKSRAFGLAVEVKSDGTAVLLPGSTHPDTGGIYRWLEGHDPDSMPLAELPRALLEDLLRPQDPRPAPRSGSSAIGSQGTLVERYAASVRSAPDGDRNNTLNKHAYFLGGIVARGELDRGDVESALLEAAMNAGLPEREARATIASGLKKGIASPLPKPDGRGAKKGGRRMAEGIGFSVDGAFEPTTIESTNEVHDPSAAGSKGVHSARQGGRGARGPGTCPLKVPDGAPFPVHLLPESVQEYCRAIAHAVSVDESMAGLAILAALGGAIGLSREAVVTVNEWTEPPVIWGAIVMSSGGGKSPLVAAVLEPILRYQIKLKRQYDQERTAYDIAYRVWQEEEKKRLKRGQATAPPVAPVQRHVYASDATVEAIVDMFKGEAHGITAVYDELICFFGNMGRYSGKAQADLGIWLSMSRGAPIKVDRVVKGSTIVESAMASVIGGIQPRILAACCSDSAYASGLVARFLFVLPRRAVRQLRPCVPKNVKANYHCLVTKLLKLELDDCADELGMIRRRARRIPFAPECEEFLREYLPQWSIASMLECETLDAAMSKLEAYALRFALIRRVTREAVEDAGPDDPISLEDLQAGIQLARWFKEETRRVLISNNHDLTTNRDRKIASRRAIIESLGGQITASAWRKRHRRMTKPQAEQELDELVDAGYAEWREHGTTAKGGRPTRVCVLLEPGTTDFEMNEEVPDDDEEQVNEAVDSADEGGIGGFGLRGHGKRAGITLEAQAAPHGDEKEGLSETALTSLDQTLYSESTLVRKAHYEGSIGEYSECLPQNGPQNGLPDPVEADPALGARSDGGLSERASGEQEAQGPLPKEAESHLNACDSFRNPQNPQNPGTTSSAQRQDLRENSAPVSETPSDEGNSGARGPADPAGVEQVPDDLETLVADLLAAFPGAREVGPAAVVVPIESVFGFGAATLTSCRCCGSPKYWRLRDTGRGEPGDLVCERCHAPAQPEHLIERLNIGGGDA